MSHKILLLGSNDSNTRFVFNHIHARFPICCAIIETKKDKLLILRKRMKRLGFGKVVGQVAFRLLIIPVLHRSSSKRLAEIRKLFKLNDQPIPEHLFFEVDTVNDEASINQIKKVSPDLIVVNGTRIISKKVLSQITCPIFNIHVGITPQYRGVHGMYWALTQNDAENAGVTIHRIDSGIDTGEILRQAKVAASANDNFITYPLLQFATGLSLYTDVIDDFFNGRLTRVASSGDKKSKLWSHPTLFEYLYFRFLNGVR